MIGTSEHLQLGTDHGGLKHRTLGGLILGILAVILLFGGLQAAIIGGTMAAALGERVTGGLVAVVCGGDVHGRIVATVGLLGAMIGGLIGIPLGGLIEDMLSGMGGMCAGGLLLQIIYSVFP